MLAMRSHDIPDEFMFLMNSSNRSFLWSKLRNMQCSMPVKLGLMGLERGLTRVNCLCVFLVCEYWVRILWLKTTIIMTIGTLNIQKDCSFIPNMQVF